MRVSEGAVDANLVVQLLARTLRDHRGFGDHLACVAPFRVARGQLETLGKAALREVRRERRSGSKTCMSGPVCERRARTTILEHGRGEGARPQIHESHATSRTLPRRWPVLYFLRTTPLRIVVRSSMYSPTITSTRFALPPRAAGPTSAAAALDAGAAVAAGAPAAVAAGTGAGTGPGVGVVRGAGIG